MPRLMGVSHQAPLGVRVTKSEKGESLDGENYLVAFQGGKEKEGHYNERACL